MEKDNLREWIKTFRWVKKNPLYAVQRLFHYEEIIERRDNTIKELKLKIKKLEGN
ncbi:hypothetical protein PBI_PBS1_288 [Bacillus phage PBS1]|uniref:Uncharacterized protein n=1 Tax=Bacillus phage PBS1 TaxID=2884423 RepID=A0A223LCH4_BPPB1|nr:hypothetical protein FK780_gp159 [Bacillus phage PBS1]ASU00110.1 hypothetical protein PBI_PBS1_288 [Bacillus phage PBS1]WCS68218.1 hypothetical protein Goe21_01080 [Bacillus phage vB_BsuM-Goe21]BDE75381.1 hypothetical protein [Bacillus phage PBS1]